MLYPRSFGFMFGGAISDFVSFENHRLSRKNPEERKLDAGLRLVIVQLAALIYFLVLFAALISTQIFAGSYYRNLAENNRLREILIHAPRGIIYDRNGIPLTINLPAFRLITCDTDNQNCQSQIISKDQEINLETQTLPANKHLETDSSRSYPFGPVFAPVLGYVSENSSSGGFKTGQGGVEEFYENQLRGKNGKELIEVDATGRKLRTVFLNPPTAGRNLTLTIDANLQKVAYEALGDYKGAVVVSNPQTGAVLALVSKPSFDPNYFTDLNMAATDRSEKIQAFFNDPQKPLFDRAIAGTYPPGSTFKIITATAGLESGAITAQTKIEDTGELVIGPYKFPNWKWLQDGGTQGILDVIGGLQKSNDIFFYKTAEATGIDNLVLWAKKFGLGSSLGIDLPGEAGGLVRRDREWFLGDTYHEAIGQGDLLVTPIQDNAWTNVIANGGKLCRPHVLPENQDCRNLGIQESTIDLIRKGLIAACEPGGTGYPLFGFVPQIACKTGTAEYGTQSKTHAWFTSFSPDISVTVLVEGGGEGSDVAAPIAKKIYEAWYGR